MKVYNSITDFPSGINTVITIGTFDGVHEGHIEVIKRLNSIAYIEGCESVLLTFNPHPRYVLHADDQKLRLLNTITEKTDQLKKTGLQHFIIHNFTKEFSRMKSVNFIRDLLVDKLMMKHMVVGHDHHFGRNREGSYSDLGELSELYSFKLEQIPPKSHNNLTISSTKIRKLLLDGDVDVAASNLGYFYYLIGTVVSGKELGRTIGFPTANISVIDKYKLIPCDGVYAVKVSLEKEYFGMLNIGTINQTIEVYIFDFFADIYDFDIKVEFIKRIREEKQFDNLALLKEQLKLDESSCRRIFNI